MVANLLTQTRATLTRLGALKPTTSLPSRLPGLESLPSLGDLPKGFAGTDWSEKIARLASLKPVAPLCGLTMPMGVQPTPLVPEGATFDEHVHHGASGTISYRLYVPSHMPNAPMPLVVMLHGCTQSPEDFAAGTRMNELAEAEGFLVAYPRQTQRANAQKCWNWFDAKDQQRDHGEPALIAGLTREIIATHPVDAGRVYVAGLSAGGAAAAIMAQRYPDLYAAAGVHSGLAAGAATDMPGAFAAMRGGGRSAPGRSVPTIVFHGDADRTVHPSNGDQVLNQSRGGTGLATAETRGSSDGGMAFTKHVEADAKGRPMLEHWRLHGAGHAWSGGSAAGTYTEPRGPDASREMLRFFLAHRLDAGA
ncbi:MAG: extracellular catalytic domain type 1 short-chain-length polyhydroxyalkanoate depolymerase [Janthinobacterium lividum]